MATTHASTIEIRLYEHEDQAATAYDRHGDQVQIDGVHGQDYAVGDVVDGWVLTYVGSRIQTGDARGNYLRAEAVRQVTDTQIRALRREASEAGDILQSVICDLATGDMVLDGDESSSRMAQVTDTYPVLTREECRRVADMTEEEARAACAEAIAQGQG